MTRLCPRPDLHRFEAERLSNMGQDFAAQVQFALEQQALAQQKIETKKPKAAAAFFAKAKELMPKPVTVDFERVLENEKSESPTSPSAK